MSDYDHNQDPYNYDDDERFYEETALPATRLKESSKTASGITT